MKTNDNVRKRRQERLKHIQEQDVPAPDDRAFGVTMLEQPAVTGADPEDVWRQRQEQLIRSLERGSTRANKGMDWPVPPIFGWFRVRAMVSVAVFLLLWAFVRSGAPGSAQTEERLRSAFRQEWSFDSVAAMYHSWFEGAPSILPSFSEWSARLTSKPVASAGRELFPPVLGEAADRFADTHEGIHIRTKAAAPVAAMDSGRVVFAGLTETNGFTIIIQHPNETQTVNGLLQEPLVKVNDWVKGGQQIASVSGKDADQATFYFAVKKQDKFVDPSEVIHLE